MYQIMEGKSGDYEIIGMGLVNQDGFEDVIADRKLHGELGVIIMTGYNGKKLGVGLENIEEFLGIIGDRSRGSIEFNNGQTLEFSRIGDKERFINCVRETSVGLREIETKEAPKGSLILNESDLKENSDSYYKNSNLTIGSRRKCDWVLVFGGVSLAMYKIEESGFDLRDNMEKISEVFPTCQYCNDCDEKDVYTFGMKELCEDCRLDLTAICAEIGGNQQVIDSIIARRI